MGVFDFLSSIFKEKPKEIRYNLDPQSVKTNNLIKGLTNQVAELHGELARERAEKSERKELESQGQEEESVKQYLQEDKQRLIKQNQQKFFSLKAFFHRYFKDEKFRNNLHITTFDRSESLGIFDDFGFSGNSFVILARNNRKVLGTREIKGLFQSVSALSNDISSGKIPVNLNKDGGYIPNLMLWEAPEIIKEEDGFRYSEARKKPLYELLQKYEARIQSKDLEIQENELTISEQQIKIDDLSISSKANEKSAEVARAEKVKMVGQLSNVEKLFVSTENELTKFRQMYAIQEEEISSLERTLTEMRAKVEGKEVQSAIDKALETVLHIKSTLAMDEPEKVGTEDGPK